MLVVLDTNVYISFCLSSRGAPAEIVQRWQSNDFDVALSPALLEELERVLTYPKLQKAFRLTEKERASFIRTLKASGLIVEPTLTVDVVQKDADDNRLIECAVSAGAQFIVSGDAHLLDLGHYQGTHIIDPARFLALLQLEDS